MIDKPTRACWRFLYRQSEGRIGPGEWVRASLPPAAIVAALTLIWLAIAPSEEREPTNGLIDISIMATYAYLMIYAFVVLLCAVAQYFVSAKRFADRGKAPALAGVAPFAIFLAGAAAGKDQPGDPISLRRQLVFARPAPPIVKKRVAVALRQPRQAGEPIGRFERNQIANVADDDRPSKWARRACFRLLIASNHPPSLAAARRASTSDSFRRILSRASSSDSTRAEGDEKP